MDDHKSENFKNLQIAWPLKYRYLYRVRVDYEVK